jgi:hypothetical protein
MSELYLIQQKITNYILKKYNRIRIKPISSYIKNNIIRSFTDEMSDKTSYELSKPMRGRKSTTTNYDKRDSSLDIIRNDENNYEIVLPYQRIVK